MTGLRATSLTASIAVLATIGAAFVQGGSASSQPSRAETALHAQEVTLRVRPTLVGPRAGTTRVTVTGSVDSGRAGESVAFQGKTCPSDFFRVVGGAVTEENGTFFNFYFPQTTTTLRAVWRDQTSAPVTIRMQASVRLRQRPGGKVEVAAGNFWRKRVVIERFDNRLGSWSKVSSVVLAEDTGFGTRATFRPPVPKGTLIRAVLPRSVAAPCFLAGVSNSVRT